MIACLSPNGRNAYEGREPLARLLVGTSDGVAVLKRDPNGPWAMNGVTLGGRHISSLLFEPTNGTVFAGVHGGGLYRSSDGGDAWELVSDLAQEHVFCLGSSEHDGDVVLYAGTEPAHLFRSSDDGGTWQELTSLREIPDIGRWTFPAPPHEAHVKNITCDPYDPDVIFVSVEQGGLFRSGDGGGTWNELDGYSKPGEVPYKDVHRVVVGPGDLPELYLTGGTGMYSSADGGETWRQRTSSHFRIGYPDALVVAPRADDLMFMAGAARSPFFWLQTPIANAAVMCSRDRGRSWDELSPGLPEDGRANIEAMAIHSSPDRLELFLGTTDGDVHMTRDEGATFERIATGIAPISKLTHNAILEGTFVRG